MLDAENIQSETRGTAATGNKPRDELLIGILTAIAINHANHFESTPKRIAVMVDVDEKTILDKLQKYSSESYLIYTAGVMDSAVDTPVSLTATGWRYIAEFNRC